MSGFPEGNAIVYCEGAFRTTNGKTAHGLVRKTRRYRVLSVVDSTCAGQNSGTVLDGRPNDIPIFDDQRRALDDARARNLADGEGDWVRAVDQNAEIEKFGAPEVLPSGARVYLRRE